MNTRKFKKTSKIVGMILAVTMIVSAFIAPLQNVFALDSDFVQNLFSAPNTSSSYAGKDLTRGAYYDMPSALTNYLTAGKTLEFDLNKDIAEETVKFRFADADKSYSSLAFVLKNGDEGLDMTTTSNGDGWYHYVIRLSTVPHSVPEEGETEADMNYALAKFRVMTTVPADTQIANIKYGTDITSLPEAFTTDYDTVTLESLGFTGTDYKTTISSGRYYFTAKSKTNSEIIKFGWQPKITDDIDWKIALDTYWNAACMVWFRPDHIYFCPGWSGGYDKLMQRIDPITSGTHQVEFGRLRVTAGPNYGKDYVFLKIDGELKASGYTDYYQTAGGYVAHNGGEITKPSNQVCFVGDGVSQQRYSGFGKPDEYVSDIDVVNISDIVPGGVVKNTMTAESYGNLYPYTVKSKTRSTIVKFVLKTGNNINSLDDGSFMVVDIGGNCGFCRSYIAAGNHESVMFAWEFEECTSGTKSYKFESNSWYAFEQGRLRVTNGVHKGEDWVYLKINGEIISSFYVKATSRPPAWESLYIEANQNFEIYGYNELAVKYYNEDGSLYLDQMGQKGFTAKQPANPTSSDGKFFLGWYTAKSGGTKFDFKNTKLTANTNLYAHFTDKTAIATFDTDNGANPTAVTVGQNALFSAPADPTKTEVGHEWVFAGWKNETTGKIFNFATDTISADTTFTAQYKEKEYYVSYYANGKLVKKVAFTKLNPTVTDPAVPTVANMTGVWESHPTTGLTGGLTVNAIYNGKTTTAGSAIKLTVYKGNNVYLNTDVVHNYLSTEGNAKQSAFMREYKTINPNINYQDHQNTTFKWTDSGKNSSYTVYFADNKDFKNAFIVTTTSKSLVNEVGIFTPGKTYYWYVYGNTTKQSSAVDTFKTINTPVRYITAGKVTNMRDEGGYMTEDGYKVKYGMVYRGASLDEYHSHIDDAARQVFSYLGINSEIELRGGLNHDTTGWDENNTNVNYIPALILEAVPQTQDSNIKSYYKKTFEAMADESNYPFYFHCSAGADRTGTFGFLLNGLLGVPYENLREDYELTSLSEVGLRAADYYSSTEGSLDGLYKTIMTDYAHGSDDLSVAIENFLKEFFGVKQETIDSIRNIMLDKNPTPNTKAYKITVDVQGKKTTYEAFPGIYFMPETPSASGKLFKGFYVGKTKYNGYATGNVTLTAKFEDIVYEPYDSLTLKDLGIEEDKIKNRTNTVYTYDKTAESGGRLFQFILEPIGDMNNGDGPQLALTDMWSLNSLARVWIQSNTQAHFYYSGGENNPPDESMLYAFEPGKEYKIQFAVRIMKNKGYEGKKIFEITINGETVLQYIGCKAPLDENKIFFHGGTGAAWLKNWPVYKTVKLYNGSTLYKTVKVERSGCLADAKVADPAAKNGVPFAGWYTAKTGGKEWDIYEDLIYENMTLYAHFANVKKVTAIIEGEKRTYRVPTGETLDSISAPQKAGNVFAGWAVNGKVYTGKVTSDMTVTATFEPYSFDDYDVISLRDLGINKDQYFGDALGEYHVAAFTYVKAAETGGRVFKATYVPSENMMNGPQISFSQNWTENYLAKVYFTKFDEMAVYGNCEMDAPPTVKMDASFEKGKEYNFEIGVRVLNNKGYKGVKVFTVYMNGKLIYEQFNNHMPLEGNEVFLQGESSGYLRNVNIYRTVTFYDGDKVLATKQVLRGDRVKSYGKLSDRGDRLFKGWYDDYGNEWDFDLSSIYMNTNLRAKFEKRTYPVLLMVDNILYKRLNVFVGESVNIFTVPTKEGYVFDKWLNEDGTEYDMSLPVNKSVTLVASFTKAEAAPQPEQKQEATKTVKPVKEEKESDFDMTYLWFCIIGLIVIAAETGVIIYKKRKKA